MTIFYLRWTEYEDRPEEFPFEINKPFIIVFAFTEEYFKIAVDGIHLMDFDLSRITSLNDLSVWDMLSGFQITNRKIDTVTTIKSIEHGRMEPNCREFEKFFTHN